jgi:hypothetical protein
MSEIVGAMFKYMMVLLGLGAVVATFWSSMGMDKTSRALSAQTELSANVLDVYSAQSNFSSLSNTVMVNAKKVPETMVSGTSIKNPWGGDVTLAVNGGNTGRFDITQTLVPSDACVKMATANSRIVALTINGASQTLPVDAGNAAAACAAATNTLVTTINR